MSMLIDISQFPYIVPIPVPDAERQKKKTKIKKYKCQIHNDCL